ncbi:MAG: phosphoglycerate kinase [Sphingomonadaceae bacterium]|nr:phosphoglycerate kinase [Sphingomonadaceae bacterium]
MGLDMYAYSTAAHAITRDVDFNIDELDATRFHTWRKHPNLHGWMEHLYTDKGGVELFNCVPVRLTLDDLSELEHVIRSGELPETNGFFFGASDGSEIEDDLAFIAKAREAIEAGNAVFYSSWW